MSLTFLFLAFFSSAFPAGSQLLECKNIDAQTQVAGKVISLPRNDTSPVSLPANFSCQYTTQTRGTTWIRIRVHNALKDAQDVATIDDGTGHVARITSTSPSTSVLYQPNYANGTISIRTGPNTNSSSSILITLHYFNVYDPPVQKLMETDQRVTYVNLNHVLQTPYIISGLEKGDRIVASVARSGYVSDSFDSFYVYDGLLDNFTKIYRLDDFLNSNNILSTGRYLTVVGYSSDISRSSIIFNRYAATSGFDKVSGVTVSGTTAQIRISSGQQKTAVSFVARNGNLLVVTSLEVANSASPTARVHAIPGSIANNGLLVDYSPNSTYTFPQAFPAKFFTLIVDHCAVALRLSEIRPRDYYVVQENDSRLVFSPSYLDPQLPAGIDELYESTSPLQFSVNVDAAKIGNNGDELDVFVLNANKEKTMSIVVTESQSGTKSRALGNYLQVRMNNATSATYAKIRFSMESTGFRGLFWIPILITMTAIF